MINDHESCGGKECPTFGSNFCFCLFKSNINFARSSLRWNFSIDLVTFRFTNYTSDYLHTSSQHQNMVKWQNIGTTLRMQLYLCEENDNDNDSDRQSVKNKKKECGGITVRALD